MINNDGFIGAPSNLFADVVIHPPEDSEMTKGPDAEENEMLDHEN